MRLACASILASALTFVGVPTSAQAAPSMGKAKPAARAAKTSRPGTSRSGESRPTAAKRGTKSATKIRHGKRRRQASKPHASQEGSAAMAAWLRQYVEGKGSKGSARAVTKSMNGRGASQAAAARVLSRIDGATRAQRRQAFGPATTRSAPGNGGMQQLVTSADVAAHTAMQLLPAIVLPPQGVPNPTSFALENTGLVTVATEDDDGSDELTSFGIVAQTDGQDFILNTVEFGTNVQSGPGLTTSQKTLYSGSSAPALVITAVIEDDGGNAAAAREEIEVLVSLAASVAATMDGADRLVVLKTMVDYTIALDGVGADPSRAARSVVATPFAKGDWFPLWSTDENRTEDVVWKLAVPHQLGSGQYEILLNVPGNAPPMTTVRVRIAKFNLNASPPDGWTMNQQQLQLSLGNKSHTFYGFDGSTKSFVSVERKVLDGDVEIGLGGSVRYSPPPAPKSFKELALEACSQNPELSAAKRRSCKERLRRLRKRKKKNKKKSITYDLDLVKGNKSAYTTTYSTAQAGFKRSKNPKGSTPSATAPTSPVVPLRERSTSGNATPSASVTLSARNR